MIVGQLGRHISCYFSCVAAIVYALGHAKELGEVPAGGKRLSIATQNNDDDTLNYIDLDAVQQKLTPRVSTTDPTDFSWIRNWVRPQLINLVNFRQMLIILRQRSVTLSRQGSAQEFCTAHYQRIGLVHDMTGHIRSS